MLADIGLVELLDNPFVRVWDVSLPPGGQHPWHLHHNPYLVLSLQGSKGRMDWLDGSPPRHLSEYRGGAVYRPVSPVHRLTNIGEQHYQNRLIELKDLGEHLASPFDIGAGDRSVEGRPPAPGLADGRQPVLIHPHVSVWTLELASGEERLLKLADPPHMSALVDAPDLLLAPAGGVEFHDGGTPLRLANDTGSTQTWFVAELTYLTDLDSLLRRTHHD